MSKYGNKFTCWSCGTKFYDLGKPDPKCPKCGADPAADPNAGGAGGGLPDDDEFGGDLDDDLDGADFSDDEEEDVEDEGEADEEEDF